MNLPWSDWLPFVVLAHTFPADHPREDHFDWMFSNGTSLLTWSSYELVEYGQTVSATRLADHRLAYLEYEGPVSGNRGYVRRIEQGTYRRLLAEANQYRFELQGERFRGVLSFTLRQAPNWQLEFQPGASGNS